MMAKSNWQVHMRNSRASMVAFGATPAPGQLKLDMQDWPDAELTEVVEFVNRRLRKRQLNVMLQSTNVSTRRVRRRRRQFMAAPFGRMWQSPTTASQCPRSSLRTSQTMVAPGSSSGLQHAAD